MKNSWLLKAAVFIPAITGIIAVTFTAIDSYTSPGDAHDFQDCTSCHLNVPASGEPVERPMRMADTITRLCARCHDAPFSVSHMVDFQPPPDMQIPGDMPLDEYGNITCATCHDVHRNRINPVTGGPTYFLRREYAGNDFCMSCHQTGGLGGVPLEGGPSYHLTFMDRAHGFSYFTVSGSTFDVDPLSQACLDCHEQGNFSTSFSSGMYTHASEDLGISHPIGVDYTEAALNNPELVPPEWLHPRIVLIDGRIGCVTCHDPYAPAVGNALVIGVHGAFQDLCLACHIK